MPSKYDENTKAKAVRLVHKHQRRLRRRVGGDVGDLRAVGDERRDVALVRASGRGEVAGVPTETTRERAPQASQAPVIPIELVIGLCGEKSGWRR